MKAHNLIYIVLIIVIAYGCQDTLGIDNAVKKTPLDSIPVFIPPVTVRTENIKFYELWKPNSYYIGSFATIKSGKVTVDTTKSNPVIRIENFYVESIVKDSAFIGGYYNRNDRALSYILNYQGEITDTSKGIILNTPEKPEMNFTVKMKRIVVPIWTADYKPDSTKFYIIWNKEEKYINVIVDSYLNDLNNLQTTYFGGGFTAYYK
jgi:hypothetical protein